MHLSVRLRDNVSALSASLGVRDAMDGMGSLGTDQFKLITVRISSHTVDAHLHAQSMHICTHSRRTVDAHLHTQSTHNWAHSRQTVDAHLFRSRSLSMDTVCHRVVLAAC